VEQLNNWPGEEQFEKLLDRNWKSCYRLDVQKQLAKKMSH